MRYIIILAFVFVALFAVFFLKIIAPTDQETSIRVLSEYNQYELEEMNIQNEIGEVDLVKKDDEWYVYINHVLEPAYEKYVQEVISKLFQLRPVEFFKVEEPLAHYGLDPAVVKLQMKFKGGKEMVVNIGDVAPTGKATYLSLNKSEKVYMVPFGAVEGLTIMVDDDFKTRNIISCAYDNLKTVKINVADIDITISKMADGAIVTSVLGKKTETVQISIDEAVKLLESANTISLHEQASLNSKEVGLYKFAMDYPYISASCENDAGVVSSFSLAFYAGMFIYEVFDNPPAVKTALTETVVNFLETLKQVAKIDFSLPSKISPQNR